MEDGFNPEFGRFRYSNLEVESLNRTGHPLTPGLSEQENQETGVDDRYGEC